MKPPKNQSSQELRIGRSDFERLAAAYLQDALGSMDAELRLGSETQAAELASGIFQSLVGKRTTVRTAQQSDSAPPSGEQ